MRRVLLAVLLMAALVTGCSGLPVPARTHVRPVPVNVAVFLRDDATAAQKDAIGAKLRAAHGVSAVRFESREEAYRRFKKAFEDRPDLVNNTRPEDLPESYQARFAGRDDAVTALAAIRRMPGVQSARVPPTPSASATP